VLVQTVYEAGWNPQPSGRRADTMHQAITLVRPANVSLLLALGKAARRWATASSCADRPIANAKY
jgi:hypothetical protein